ncbi:MAG: hypothetical protein JSV52_03015 [Candidatus Zixiibacteriota bacterium]|nr:MAG: hypothetical protein JSV52_03015 [candidate division Zixibacteria bacterium]
MTKRILLVIGCLALLTGVAAPQEVVIKDFPIGVAGSIGQDIFKPHRDELKAIADTLSKYPLVRAVITGGADGFRYRQSNDAKNPALALGRAHALLNYMIRELKVDSSQIIIRTEDVAARGPEHRYAGIRIVRDLSDIDEDVAGLKSRLSDLEQRPAVEKHFTEVKEIPNILKENLGLQVSAGLSTSPFGGMPVLAGALTWKRMIFLEGIVGHTFWNGEFVFTGVDLETKRRMIGGHVVYYPREDIPVGVVGGWLRVEEMAQDYYEYVRLSEGPVFGLRASPLEFISVTGAYNPSRHREAGRAKASAENDQFLLYVTVHIGFGGAR